MTTEVDAVRLLSIAWLFGWAVFATRILAAGTERSLWFAVLAHIGFAGVPLLSDALYGIPTYHHFPGLRVAAGDDATTLIYCAYVCWVPVALVLLGRTRTPHAVLRSSSGEDGFVPAWERRLLWAALFSPSVAVLGSPDRSIYLSYGTIATRTLGDLEQYHAFVAALCLLSVVAGFSLLVSAHRLTPRVWAAILPWIFVACWLFQKRVILALVILGFIYVGWRRGRLRHGWFVAGAACGTLVVACASYIYQSHVRYIDLNDTDAYYDGVRLDFGRDGVIKQAIYAELQGPSYALLDYRGESFVFDLTMFVPRDIWPAKPWPFAVYQTARALGLPGPRPVGWAVTTSWHDEAFANCGWLAFLVGPLLIAAVCRAGDRTGNRVAGYLTMSMVVLLMALQFVAFWPIAAIWMVHMAVSRAARRRDRVWAPSMLPSATATGRSRHFACS